MNPEQITTLIVQAIFLIVYVTIFLIQRKQIDSLKDTIASMKTFMDIFNMESIKKYVELKQDHASTLASMQILDNREIKGHITEIINERGEEVAELFQKQFKEQQYQLLYVAEEAIMSLPIEEREQYIDKYLPAVKHILLPIIEKNTENKNQKV